MIGPPFFRMIDAPPLLGAEADPRPIAVLSGEPWRPMRVFAGPDETSLTARGESADPATVGRLVSALAPGVRHRWDEANRLEVRIEGQAPQGLSTTAVLAGGNAAAVETDAGWEIIQFRAAELVGDDVWRLTGLLRGQQGTEDATMAGADSGAVVVFFGPGLQRMESPFPERGLPLIWRAGPAGTPAGGAGVTEIAFTFGCRHDRPWSPTHLRCRPRDDGGFDLTWLARARLDGDRWEGEPAPSDPSRYRVRLLDGETPVRAFETEVETAVYPAADAATDFPGGMANAEVAVAQWGDGYGWGAEARTRLA